ncbi:MAG: hypothetical protein ACI4D7_07690 [Lachnospiraceae bacterium]
MRKMSMAKRFLAYTAAAAIILGTGFMGAGFNSNAETQYIVTDNVVVRDGANGTQIDGIGKGTKVNVTESETGSDGKKWNHISYTLNGVTYEGWVRSDLMSSDQSKIRPDEEPQTTAPEQPDTAREPDAQEPDTQEPDAVQEPETGADGVDFSMPEAGISGDGYQADGDLSFSVMGETMTIASDFTNVQIPSGFSKTEITYNDQTIQGLKYEYADVLLVYLTDAQGEGDLFVLDTERQIVFSFVTISSGENQLILLVPPADSQIASSYGKTIYASDEDSAVTAYQYNQLLDTISASTVTAEYYYVYGVTKNGIPGWYLYDDVEKNYIRSTTDLSVELDGLTDGDPAQEESGDNSLEKMLVVGMGAVCLICIILAIAFGIRSVRARKGLPEEEEEEEEEEELSFMQRRKQEREYRYFMENFDEEGNDYVEEKIPEQEQIVSQIEDDGWKENADYDVQISDKEDYDLTDENTEADLREFDEIEDILLAGLEESISALDRETGADRNSETGPVEKAESGKTTGSGKKAHSEQDEDEWNDLEFIDL